MKKILLILLVFGSVNFDVDWFDYFKADYFISETGNDNNSGTAPWDAWATVAKVNATTFATGDRIAFKAGDVWSEGLIVDKDSITFKAFGSGANPVISSLEWNEVTYASVVFRNINFSVENYPENYDGNIFYVSADGSDSNPGTKAEPFLTITKVNTLTLAGDDAVLFNVQDTFVGTITVGQSGTSGNEITFGAYGNSAYKPVISGFTTISGWTQENDTIWSKVITVEGGELNMVTVDGVNTAMGRWPNAGTWNTYESHVRNTSITDNQLTGTPNWTGAEVVMRQIRWSLARCLITNHTTTTLTFTPQNTIWNEIDGYGYFIQNDIKTLDVENEWYYDGTKFYIHGNPTGKVVKIATSGKLVNIGDYDYVTFKNLNFQGANDNAIVNVAGQNINVTGCDFQFNNTAIFADNSNAGLKSMTIDGNTFNHHQSDVIKLVGSMMEPMYIANNTIKNTGLLLGMQDLITVDAINCYAENSVIEYNNIDSVGHIGIAVRGDWDHPTNGHEQIVRYNYVKNTGLSQYDAAGIYVWGTRNTSVTNNIVIERNDVETTGIGDWTNVGLNGIYYDEYNDTTYCANNTVAGARSSGFNLIDIKNGTFRNNLCYDNGVSQFKLSLSALAEQYPPVMTDMNIKQNKFIAKSASQLAYMHTDDENNIATHNYGVSDSNYFARPIDDFRTIGTGVNQSTLTYRSLEEWRTYISRDANSNISQVVTDTTATYLFEYNATKTAKTVALTGIWKDIEGTAYSGTITLQPYTSIVLIQGGTTYQNIISTDMIAYWNLDQNSNTLNDSVGTNHLTNSGGVVNQTGKIGQAVQFDTSTDYLSVAHNSTLMPTGNAFTLSLWLYATATPTSKYLLNFRDNATVNQILIRIDGSNKFTPTFYNTAGTSYSATPGAALAANNWYHLVIVNYGDGLVPKAFINGIHASTGYTTLFSGTLRLPANGNLLIGNRSIGEELAPTGLIDEVGIWDKALSEAAVNYLYNAGSGKTYPFNP